MSQLSDTSNVEPYVDSGSKDWEPSDPDISVDSGLDLEKAFPFLQITTSIAYYKRNMYVYNLFCHELSSCLGFM